MPYIQIKKEIEMDSGLCDFIVFMCIFLIFILALIIPFAYFEGSARSDFLKETKDIEIVWYKAAFLPDTVFINGEIKIK